MTRKIVVLSILVPVMLGMPAYFAPSSLPSVSACACCSSEGHWSEWSAPINDFEWSELEGVQFSTSERLLTEVDDDAKLKAIFADEFNEFKTRLVQSGRTWTVSITTPKGRKGSLTLLMPARAERFHVDPRDRPGGGGGPLLYKEMRFSGVLRPAGFFKVGGPAQTRFRLILQGRGNNCFSNTDFSSWILQVRGKGFEYDLFGAIS